jgi:predicted DNA binding CopG/RHH family protein
MVRSRDSSGEICREDPPTLKPSTKTISLRLPQHLLGAIKVAANARDVPYQSLIKVWLQEQVQSR